MCVRAEGECVCGGEDKVRGGRGKEGRNSEHREEEKMMEEKGGETELN